MSINNIAYRGYVIGKAQEADLERIVKINNDAAQWVGEKDIGFFKEHLNLPDFYVTEAMIEPDYNNPSYDDEPSTQVAGFVMAMPPGVDYHSPNYDWFATRMENFLYVDRIALEPLAKGLGYGKSLYAHLLDKRGNTPIVCEISPENAQSIKFHMKNGFRKIDSFKAGGKLQLAYILK